MLEVLQAVASAVGDVDRDRVEGGRALRFDRVRPGQEDQVELAVADRDRDAVDGDHGREVGALDEDREDAFAGAGREFRVLEGPHGLAVRQPGFAAGCGGADLRRDPVVEHAHLVVAQAQR
ncbi:hypothetical protein ADL26_16920, partial [Thermoactinomyces vulgaris]